MTANEGSRHSLTAPSAEELMVEGGRSVAKQLSLYSTGKLVRTPLLAN